MAQGICTICGREGPLVVCRAARKNRNGRASPQRDGACPRCARMMAQSVPEFISIARQEHELTQQQLASLLGVPLSAVVSLENRHTKVFPELLIRMADAFSMPLDTLVGRTPPS